jgi:microcystin-dependent protein
MSNPFIAEIRIFPFNFPPKGWAFCDGQILPISQNTALFSLLGTNYGGNGTTNFALPNLQGCAAIHTDSFSNGGSNYPIGASLGSATVALLSTEMPAHSHSLSVSSAEARFGAPGPSVAPGESTDGLAAYSSAFDQTALGTAGVSQISVAGGSQPHNNMMPYLTLNFCIALQGVFPPRG